jgi:hypothetical protein
MRKATWILALGFIVAVAPSAWADDFTPTFSLADVTSGGNVSFPSPSISETWSNSEANVGDFITLASIDNPGDVYTWSNTLSPDADPNLADYTLSITDVTTGDTQLAIGMVGIGDPLFESTLSEDGTLTFTPVGTGTAPTPEPGTLGLVFAGVGGLLAARKRRATLPPSASSVPR